MRAFWRPRADAAADPEAAFSLATRLAADGDIDGAREAYRQVANSGHPRYAAAAARKFGQLNQRQGRLRQAHEAYQVAIESGHPDVAPLAMVDMGNLIRDSLYPENARPYYQAAVDSGHPEAAREAARHLAGGQKSLVPNGPRLHRREVDHYFGDPVRRPYLDAHRPSS